MSLERMDCKRIRGGRGRGEGKRVDEKTVVNIYTWLRDFSLAGCTTMFTRTAARRLTLLSLAMNSHYGDARRIKL